MILEDSFESEVTSPTALNGHGMCGGVFEMYLAHYLECRVVRGMAAWQALSALLVFHSRGHM